MLFELESSVTMQIPKLYIENTMLVSFDIKFIWRDQKQRRNSKAC